MNQKTRGKITPIIEGGGSSAFSLTWASTGRINKQELTHAKPVEREIRPSSTHFFIQPRLKTREPSIPAVQMRLLKTLYTVYAMGPRAALLVFLGWLTVQMCSGSLVAMLVAALPYLKPIGLPFAYVIQATAGVAFLCAAEGITFRQLVHRVALYTALRGPEADPGLVGRWATQNSSPPFL